MGRRCSGWHEATPHLQYRGGQPPSDLRGSDHILAFQSAQRENCVLYCSSTNDAGATDSGHPPTDRGRRYRVGAGRSGAGASPCSRLRADVQHSRARGTRCEQSLPPDVAQLPADGRVRIPLSQPLHTAHSQPGLIRRIELSLAFNGPTGLTLRSAPPALPAYGRSLGVP
jgi:hypothetical protein